jgi:undecaprenyl phosphate-alpha-L-ara4N flippase subunit ArnE
MAATRDGALVGRSGVLDGADPGGLQSPSPHPSIREHAVPVVTLMALLGGALLAASGTLMLKAGANGRTEVLQFVNWQILAGLALYGLGSLLWIYCMSRQPLSVVYPFTALSFVLVLGGAIVFQGERPSPTNLIGVAVVIAGIGLIVWGRR